MRLASLCPDCGRFLSFSAGRSYCLNCQWCSYCKGKCQGSTANGCVGPAGDAGEIGHQYPKGPAGPSEFKCDSCSDIGYNVLEGHHVPCACRRTPTPIPDIEQSVINDILTRQRFGIGKYGQTVAQNPLSLLDWLQHAYEESLDLPIYLKRSIEEIKYQQRLLNETRPQ